jgi:hypothetical protein
LETISIDGDDCGGFTAAAITQKTAKAIGDHG